MGNPHVEGPVGLSKFNKTGGLRRLLRINQDVSIGFCERNAKFASSKWAGFQVTSVFQTEHDGTRVCQMGPRGWFWG